METEAIVRKLSWAESSNLEAYRSFGGDVTVDTLHLRCAKHLQDSHVIAALQILQKKLQHLRVVIIEKGKEKLFKEPMESKIDYQRVENSDWRTVHHVLLEHQFDTIQGPLWCCRLIPLDKSHPSEKIGVPSNMPEPYALVFCHLHVITDGITNMQSYGQFIRILNNVIGEKEVIEKPIDLAPSMQNLISREMWLKLRDIPYIFRFIRSQLFPKNNYFINKFESPKGQKPKTRMIFRPLDREHSQKFIRKCKQSGATFHGAFTLAAAIAMCDLVEEKVEYTKDIGFMIFQSINTRRFFHEGNEDIYGNYASFILDDIKVKKDIRKRFWEYAKDYSISLHNDMYHRTLQSERFLYYINKNPNALIKTYEEHGKAPLAFGATNVGNIDCHVGGTGEHVEIVSLCRSAALLTLGLMAMHTIQTLKGMVNYSLDYLTSYISEELAIKYAEKTIETLIEVSEL